MIRTLLKWKASAGEIVEAVASVGEVALGFKKERRKIAKQERDLALVDRAWKMLEEGTLVEFSVGDIHLVAASEDEEEEGEEESKGKKED